MVIALPLPFTERLRKLIARRFQRSVATFSIPLDLADRANTDTDCIGCQVDGRLQPWPFLGSGGASKKTRSELIALSGSAGHFRLNYV